MRSAADLFEELCALDESSGIEAKQGRAIDRAVLETICAFSNEPRLGGGYLLLETPNPPRQPHELGADPHQLPTDPHQPGPDPHQLPAELAQRVAAAGQRPRRPVLRALVRALCAWQPLSARELAAHLGNRDPKVLLREHLSAMVEAGELAYTIPQMPNQIGRAHV